jgi:flagellar biosynthetic protein FliO
MISMRVCLNLKFVLLVMGLVLCSGKGFGKDEVQSNRAGALNQESDNSRLDESQIPLHMNDAVGGKKENNQGSGQWQWLSLGALLLLFGGSVYYLRKKSLPINKTNAFNIKVLATHHLGPRKGLYIIHVAGEAMLLGVTETQINLIKPLALLDDELKPTDAPVDFGSRLKDQYDHTDEEDFAFQSIRGGRQWS